MVATERVLAEALELPPIERAVVIERLFQSFDTGSDADREARWADEVESRFAAYDRGEIKATPAEEVFARINRR